MFDGQAMWRLARDTRTLDLNSPYAYLMACRNFPGTCVVAVSDDELCGFVTAMRPPSDPSAVFVWQVGVADHMRGRGVAGRMLDDLVERGDCSGVDRLEATVTPSNEASMRLFRGFARRHGVDCAVSQCFPAELFPEGHEEERLLSIGPLSID